MPKRKVGKRGETWEIKTRPELLHPLLASKHEAMAKSISQAYFDIDSVYERVAEILDRNGVHTQARLLYRSYAEELWKLRQKYGGKTFELEAKAISYKYYHYGGEQEVMKEIANLFGVDISEIFAPPAVGITPETIKYYELWGAILYGW